MITRRALTVAVLVPQPTGYIHSRALLDLAEPLAGGLRDLGFDARVTTSSLGADRCIIVGPHLLVGAPPPGAILYCTEQAYRDSPWFGPTTVDAHQRHETWTYDPTNAKALRRLGVDSQCAPPGFHSSQVRGPPKPEAEREIDVLFFGSMNERRALVVNELIARGVKVAWSANLYGAERDEAVASSKIVLGMHFYPPAIFEVSRVSYLLANRAFVITEESAHMPWLGGYVAVPYRRLVDTCVEYLARPEERERVAAAGFEALSQCPAADMVGPIATRLEEGPLLTVLVPTIPGRTECAARLVENLENQAEGKPVEIIAMRDNFQRTEGRKRNEMLAMARGIFSVFIDDDDRIAPDYVTTLLAAIEASPAAKVIVFDVEHCPSGARTRRVTYGLECEHADTLEHATRKPNHLMCWRTGIARSVAFPDLRYGCDTAWAHRVAPFVTVEEQARIERTLYWYDDRGASRARLASAHSEAG